MFIFGNKCSKSSSNISTYINSNIDGADDICADVHTGELHLGQTNNNSRLISSDFLSLLCISVDYQTRINRYLDTRSTDQFVSRTTCSHI